MVDWPNEPLCRTVVISFEIEKLPFDVYLFVFVVCVIKNVLHSVQIGALTEVYSCDGDSTNGKVLFEREQTLL